MTTAQIKQGTKAEIEGMLAGVSSLETPELELFFQQVAQVLAARKVPSLTQRESDLFLKINAGYPAALREKYERLSAKKENQSITQGERQELIALTEQFESLERSFCLDRGLSSHHWPYTNRPSNCGRATTQPKRCCEPTDINEVGWNTSAKGNGGVRPVS